MKKSFSPPWVVLALFLVVIVSPELGTVATAEAAAADTEQTCSANDQSCQETPPQPQRIDPTCKDDNEKCDEWASTGECTYNPGYMLKSCRRSCMVCSDIIYSEEALYVGKDIGVTQLLEGSDDSNNVADKTETAPKIRQAREYLQSDEILPHIQRICQNKSEKCSVWAALGHCETNPHYMKTNCAPVCQSCLYGTKEDKCPVDSNAPEAWGPGDLDAMFSRLTSEPYLSEYDVQILSSPNKNGGPWVITMENVLSEEEAKNFIKLGAVEGYRRSADVGKMNADGSTQHSVNHGRTSSNAWCLNQCYENETSQRVIDRLTNITGIPEENSEYLQLLQYEPGQLYQPHHDYIPHQIRRQQGVRILTMYLYLNEVEAGGGTNFDKLGLTVMPKTGRALLWPSVMNGNPHEKDPRTNHQALPVEAGIKYGANAWFHMRDFKGPMATGCM